MPAAVYQRYAAATGNRTRCKAKSKAKAEAKAKAAQETRAVESDLDILLQRKQTGTRNWIAERAFRYCGRAVIPARDLRTIDWKV